jgi:hypothetical protein
LGPLTVEGIPRGRYRLIEQKDAEKLLKFEKASKFGDGRDEKGKRDLTQRAQRTQTTQRRGRKTPV